MTSFQVADVNVGALDAGGAVIRAIYAKYPPYYAVYQTDDRVAVQYSDLPDAAKIQHAAVSRLDPLKGEINYLVEGWRSRRRKSRAASDRRVADALAMACEGDPDGAVALLQLTRDAIVGECGSRAEFYYLVIASTVSFAVTTFVWAMRFSSFSQFLSFPPEAHNLILGAAAGTQGAFFSIAIAIRQRAILPDKFMLNNAFDAILRIVIGFMGASLLICLLEAKLVTFGLGGQPINLISAGSRAWLSVFAVGFTAGFSERLVPDLLGRASVNGTSSNGSSRSGGGHDGGGPAAVHNDPVPPPAVGGPAIASLAAPSAPAGDLDHATDVCLSGGGVSDDEATPDAALPPARGGVALA